MEPDRPRPAEPRLTERLTAVRMAAGAVASHRAALTEAVAAFSAAVREAYAAGISEAAVNAALVDFDEIHPLPPDHPTMGAGITDGDPPHLWGVALRVLDDAWVAFCYLCLDADGNPWHGEPAERNDQAVPELRAHLITAGHAAAMRRDVSGWHPRAAAGE